MGRPWLLPIINCTYCMLILTTALNLSRSLLRLRPRRCFTSRRHSIRVEAEDHLRAAPGQDSNRSGAAVTIRRRRATRRRREGQVSFRICVLLSGVGRAQILIVNVSRNITWWGVLSQS